MTSRRYAFSVTVLIIHWEKHSLLFSISTIFEAVEPAIFEAVSVSTLKTVCEGRKA